MYGYNRYHIIILYNTVLYDKLVSQNLIGKLLIILCIFLQEKLFEMLTIFMLFNLFFFSLMMKNLG